LLCILNSPPRSFSSTIGCKALPNRLPGLRAEEYGQLQKPLIEVLMVPFGGHWKRVGRMATGCLVRIDHCRCRAALKSRISPLQLIWDPFDVGCERATVRIDERATVRIEWLFVALEGYDHGVHLPSLLRARDGPVPGVPSRTSCRISSSEGSTLRRRNARSS
jgi:hypothetical protein